MEINPRRYDIDWVRVIAIGLLLIYHVAIGFQSWGMLIGFITTEKTWESLWIPMSMLNIWRIPLLFFVSGMGVYFAIQNRTWKQLLWERASRILLPFLFGYFCIVPLHLLLWQHNYHMQQTYLPNPGHLWFLGNIFIYVVALLPFFFYLKNNQTARLTAGVKKVISSPLGLIVLLVAFAAEAILVNPGAYTLYAMTWHGFFLGLLAFFFGFCFVWSGPAFWEMLLKGRWLFVCIAALLFTIRIIYFQRFALNYLLAIESVFWIVAVLAFSYKYLNRPSKALRYLSQAAYPVYIIHMVFLYLGSLLFFPVQVNAPLQFTLVLLFTAVGCFTLYEFLIRRVNLLRPLFGLKRK
ncbi:acyltransferase [Adhaeribacter arboris]|uniref:Acyltransferase n=1 Tax=Adhaeribacter arboris TaxID=2072846 RepID=A0A2T2YHK5_9BACT|nr:acyltransferase family protein [Adhaeribacter arboris]PSR54993.1 acyltransferase [Adhaeribacter arboris]